MLAHKKFKQLRKSIISQNQQNLDNQQTFSGQSNNMIALDNSSKVSFKKIIQQTKYSPIKQTLIKQDSLKRFEQFQYKNQSDYKTPLKYQTKNLSPLRKNNLNNYKKNDVQHSIYYDKNKQNTKHCSNSFLKFDTDVKKKLNFNSIPERQFHQRFSSKKKNAISGISFKNIIENSPQCNTQRDLKFEVKNIPKPYAQSERINNLQRKLSITKLKSQFANIKNIISVGKPQIEKKSKIIYKQSTNQSEKIETNKENISLNRYHSQIEKEKEKETYLIDSINDLVNISIGSQNNNRQSSELDMSPNLMY